MVSFAPNIPRPTFFETLDEMLRDEGDRVVASEELTLAIGTRSRDCCYCGTLQLAGADCAHCVAPDDGNRPPLAMVRVKSLKP